ncbi:hypothetical protein [Actinomadura parmotrematis]|uniref:Uncharacterized protein n=1 Tax=Actinomadura parmotrematis TaxID=2864039 RepID=A0ABS7FQD9_9ACTN|nr:hypothetical protein [Actinomadura parmotrematis]MBW8482612.1 hypothetical protein [Actinomadura parmotrematis]
METKIIRKGRVREVLSHRWVRSRLIDQALYHVEHAQMGLPDLPAEALEPAPAKA